MHIHRALPVPGEVEVPGRFSPVMANPVQQGEEAVEDTHTEEHHSVQRREMGAGAVMMLLRPCDLSSFW